MTVRAMPLADRFWAKVDQAGPNGCWLWTGAKGSNGYGHLFGTRSEGRREQQRQYLAHRVAYRLMVGPIPEGLVLDHLCRVSACVNPSHLEAVPQRLNVLRGNSLAARYAARTHCARGHEFAGNNLAPMTKGRRCRTCANTNGSARYHARLKEKVA